MLRLTAAFAGFVALAVLAARRAQLPRCVSPLGPTARATSTASRLQARLRDGPDERVRAPEVADAGVSALDDGLAEVAVAFSSNPQLSRPDILTLRDDKGMISDDHVVPVIRHTLLRRYGAPLRRRLNATSRLLSTLELRGLNQQVIDGRLPEAVGGGVRRRHGLGGEGRRRKGPDPDRLQSFAENETLAYLYAGALRGAGFRVSVRRPGCGRRP